MKQLLLVGLLVGQGQAATSILKIFAPYKKGDALSNTLNLGGQKWIYGKWKGVANQFDNHSHWTIVLTKKPASKHFIVEYPSLACHGYLDLLTLSSERAELREHIIAGNCVHNVRLVITKITNTKAYYRAYWPEDNHLNAEGILRKVR